jgi:predicted amidohydrolase
MRVAGFQMCVNDENVQENYRKIHDTIEYASSEKADILLTPEGSLSGYHNRFDSIEVKDALQQLCSTAKDRHIGLALGTCYFENPGHCYNQIRFYEKDGRYLGFHAKTLLCSNCLDEPYSGEITYFSTKTLEVFLFQEMMIGGLICNDLWANPGVTPQPDTHLTHQLAKMGAKIIFHAVNGGRGDPDSIALNRQYHESNQRLRAMADSLYIVTVDNAFPLTKDNSCTSGIISPDGKHIIKLPNQGEHLFVQDIIL